jgi:hypothetical protein
MISIKDADRVSAIFLRTKDVESAVGCLWNLAVECIESGYFNAACQYIKKVLPLVEHPDDKAECFLTNKLEKAVTLWHKKFVQYQLSHLWETAL